jgi:hypothetical protein
VSRQRYISCALSKLFTGLAQPVTGLLQNKEAWPSGEISSRSAPPQHGQCSPFGVKKWFTHSPTKVTPS